VPVFILFHIEFHIRLDFLIDSLPKNFLSAYGHIPSSVFLGRGFLMMRGRKRVLLSWISGKDSDYALHLLRQQSDVELAWPAYYSLFHLLDQQVWRKDWVVHSQPVGSGEAAFKYLAPYIFRVAISNRRILALEDGQVTFSYKDSATDQILDHSRRGVYLPLPSARPAERLRQSPLLRLARCL
jgi:hypothetical protein